MTSSFATLHDGYLKNLLIFGRNVGGVGGFSSTKDFELRIQPEPFEASLLAHQKAVAGMFGEKIANPKE